MDSASPLDSQRSIPPVRRPPPEIWTPHAGPWFHRLLLLAAVLVIGASAALQLNEREQVALPGVNRALPGLCSFQRMTGMDCPGCGLTRCFVSLGRLDFRRAWRFNPAGILLFGLVLFQLPYRTGQLWRLRRGLPEWQLGWLAPWALLGAAMLLIVQWLIRLSPQLL